MDEISISGLECVIRYAVPDTLSCLENKIRENLIESGLQSSILLRTRRLEWGNLITVWHLGTYPRSHGRRTIPFGVNLSLSGTLRRVYGKRPAKLPPVSRESLV